MRNRIIKPGKGLLGKLEQRVMAYAQFKRLSTVRVGELRPPLMLSAMQESKIFSRLARKGVIARLKRGIYLFPPRLPLGGVWNPGEYTILREMMKACRNGRYQICGWQAFNRYGFTEQFATRTFAYNNRLSGERMIAGQSFVFIKVADDRLGGTDIARMVDHVEAVMPTKARALLDAVHDWSRFDSLPAAYAWIRRSVRSDRRMAGVLAQMACRYGNQGTIRRIGYMLENLGLRGSGKRLMQKALRRSKSVIPLVPGRKMRGGINREWGVIVNE